MSVFKSTAEKTVYDRMISIDPKIGDGGFSYEIGNTHVCFSYPKLVDPDIFLKGCRVKDPLQYTSNICKAYHRIIGKYGSTCRSFALKCRELEERANGETFDKLVWAVRSLARVYIAKGGSVKYLEDLLSDEKLKETINLEGVVRGVYKDSEDFFLDKDYRENEDAISLLRIEAGTCRATAEEYMSKYDKLESELGLIKAHFNKMCQTNKELKSELENKTNHFADLEDEMGIALEKLKAKEVELKLISDAAALVDILKEENRNYSIVKKEHEELKIKYQDISSELAKLKEEDTLEAQSKILYDGKIQDLLTQLKECENDVKRCRDLASENDKLREDNKALRVEMQQLGATIRTAKGDHDRKISEMKDKIRFLNADLHGKEEKIMQYEDMMKSLREVNTRIQSELKIARDTNADLETTINAIKEDHETLEACAERAKQISDFRSSKKVFLRNLKPGADIKEMYHACFDACTLKPFYVNGIKVTKGLSKLPSERLQTVEDMIEVFCLYNDMFLLGEILERRRLVVRQKVETKVDKPKSVDMDRFKASIMNLTVDPVYSESIEGLNLI